MNENDYEALIEEFLNIGEEVDIKKIDFDFESTEHPKIIFKKMKRVFLDSGFTSKEKIILSPSVQFNLAKGDPITGVISGLITRIDHSVVFYKNTLVYIRY